MPSGYTADVANGEVTDFRMFALRCARAFGATVMQRDDSLDVLPKHREPWLDYHREGIAKAEATLAELDAMSDADVLAAMSEERRQIEESNARYKAEKEQKRARYEAMLREVEGWEPPTSDHAGLKKFMSEQLKESIDFDCRGYSTPIPNLSPSEWTTARRAKAVNDIAYHNAQIEEEIARCNEANAWIDALYASLGAPSTNSTPPKEDS